MKDRLLTLALAVAAFAMFYFLMGPRPSSSAAPVTRPLTIENGPNGYEALKRWLEAEGVQPVSLRRRFGSLREASDARSGNLLVTTVPHRYPIRTSESGPLRNWIAAGNTMLVVAGLADTPEWSMGEGMDREFLYHLRLMTELLFMEAPGAANKASGEAAADNAADAAKDDATADAEGKAGDEPENASQAPEPEINPLDAIRKFDEPRVFELVPNGPHPLFNRVQSVQALSEYPAAQWRAQSTDSSVLLELAQSPDTGEPMLWLLRHGAGQIIVSAYGSIFTNKLLGLRDNAQLMANIVRWSLSPEGRVIIDDAHQGLVDFYDPDAFYSDGRLHASLWWLLALWLVFVLGPQRLRSSSSRWQPVDVTGFVRASGGFLARVLAPAAAGQQLFENFFNDIRRHVGLPIDGAPVWDWMAARGSITMQELAEAKELHEKARRGARVDLLKLQTLLSRLRKNLL